MRTEIIDNKEAVIKRITLRNDKINIEFLFREEEDLIVFREFGFKVTKILSINQHMFYENPSWFYSFRKGLNFLPKICRRA